MWRAIAVACTVAALAVFLWYQSEARRLRGRLHWLEAEKARLEGQLTDVLSRDDAVRSALDSRIADLERARKQRERARREMLQPMPEGVRLALAALDECLRSDGYEGMRFLHARALNERKLREVEFLERKPDGSDVRLYCADSVSFHLDRSTGTLTMRFFGGTEVAGGERTELPAAGTPLVLENVRGPHWEGRVPYLLEVVGDYPKPASAPSPPHLTGSERDSWLGRLNRLLDVAGTGMRYHVDTFGDLREGVFTGAMLLGYDNGKTLSFAVEAKRMWVETGATAGVVELVLADGILRRSGGKTTIPSDGYRVLLPGVTIEQAENTMLGMVKSR